MKLIIVLLIITMAGVAGAGEIRTELSPIWTNEISTSSQLVTTIPTGSHTVSITTEGDVYLDGILLELPNKKELAEALQQMIKATQDQKTRCEARVRQVLILADDQQRIISGYQEVAKQYQDSIKKFKAAIASALDKYPTKGGKTK